MQIKKQKRINKKILIIATIATVLLIGGGTYAYFSLNSDHKNTEKSQNTATKTSSDKKTKSSDKQSAQDAKNEANRKDSSQTSEQNTTSDNKTPVKYENYTPESSEKLTGTINYAAAVDDTLVIRTTINQLISSGRCKLTLTGPSGQSINIESDMIANPSTSSCKGFDVALGRLGATNVARQGSWKINIDITADNKSGTLASEVKL